MSSTEDYVVIARRYRPQSFDEIVGNKHIVQILSRALDTNRVSHGYLFVGGRGMGKTSTARIMAKALNCEKGTSSKPCQLCDTCKNITSGNCTDVIELDAASNRGVDDIRHLKELVYVQPTLCKYKIYVIDEVHQLTKEAFNALLKTLEEPPKFVKFILCTTELEKLPTTIKSRCQLHEFQPAKYSELVESLRGIFIKEGIQADDQVFDLIARRSGGSLRDSQSLADQLLAFGSNPLSYTDALAMLGCSSDSKLLDIVTSIGRGQTSEAFKQCDEALAEGCDIGTLVNQITFGLRDFMVCKLDCPSSMFLQLSPISFQQIKEVSYTLDLERLTEQCDLFTTASNDMKYAHVPRAILEIAIAKSCRQPYNESVSRIVSNQPNTTSVPPKASIQNVVLEGVIKEHPFLKKIRELFGSKIERI